MSVVAVVGCWCLGSCVLAPLVGRAIRLSRAESLFAKGLGRGRGKHMLVA